MKLTGKTIYGKKFFPIIILFLLFTLSLVSIGSFFGSVFAYNLSPSALPRPDNNDSFFYPFDDPRNICVDDNFLYVYDYGLPTEESKIKIFSLNTNQFSKEFEVSKNLTSFSVFNGIVYTVENGQVYRYENGISSTNSHSKNTNISDVFAAEDCIYASSGRELHTFKNDLEIDSTKYLNSGTVIKGFTILNNDIFAYNSIKSEIQFYSLLNSSTGSSKSNIDEVYAISSVKNNNNKLLVLHRSRLSFYEKNQKEVNEVSSISANIPEIGLGDIISIATGNSIYVLDANKSIFKFDENLNNPINFISAAFYNNPTDIFTRHNNIYITDKNNDRVIINDGKEFSQIDRKNNEILQPVAAAADNLGNYFIAYNEDKIAGFDSQNKRINNLNEKISVKSADGKTDIENILIEDIKFDSKNNLYLLSRDNNLFVKKQNSDFFTPVIMPSLGCDSLNILAIDSSNSSPYFYFAAALINSEAVTNQTILRISNNKIIDTNISVSGLIDFAVDADDSIFVLLENNKIERYEYSSLSDTYLKSSDGIFSPEDVKNLTQITVSDIKINIGSSMINYRDILAVDSGFQTVIVIKRTDFGLSYDDLDSVIPQPGDTLLNNSQRLIRTIIKPGGANIYSRANEVNPIKLLPYGYKVIVPVFNQNSAFSLVLADNILAGSTDVTKDPITIGYINNEFLSEPLEYTEEHENECKAWINGTAIYRFPSLQSEKVTGYESVNKDTVFTILDFCYTNKSNNEIDYGYKDNFNDNQNSNNGNKWYRVKIEKAGEEYEGYILSSNASIWDGNPDLTVRPVTNAVIIAKDKNFPDLGATVYKMNTDGSLLKDSDGHPVPAGLEVLAVGTKVEVVGVFDSSKKYTKIIFYTKYGSITAYVETANLKYNGVNLVKVVAVILIIVTAIILVLIIIRMFYVRNKRITKI